MRDRFTRRQQSFTWMQRHDWATYFRGNRAMWGCLFLQAVLAGGKY